MSGSFAFVEVVAVPLDVAALLVVQAELCLDRRKDLVIVQLARDDQRLEHPRDGFFTRLWRLDRLLKVRIRTGGSTRTVRSSLSSGIIQYNPPFFPGSGHISFEMKSSAFSS